MPDIAQRAEKSVAVISDRAIQQAVGCVFAAGWEDEMEILDSGYLVRIELS
jgi:hypothetical protein